MLSQDIRQTDRQGWMAEGRCKFKDNGRCRYYHPWGIKENELKKEKSEKGPDYKKVQGEELPLTRKEIIAMIAETVQATLNQWRPQNQFVGGQTINGQMTQCMPGQIQPQ